MLKDVPYFDLAGQVVWGATAMIMSEFASVIEKAFSSAGLDSTRM
jgi:hypothetical protein